MSRSTTTTPLIDGGPESSDPLVVIVPADLGEGVRLALVEHFADDGASVIPIVERRRAERRGGDRRQRRSIAPETGERRKVRSVPGLRVAERRAALEPVEALALPYKLRRFAGRLQIVRRIEQQPSELFEIEGTRKALLAQAHGLAAEPDLYAHYFDRVLSWLCVSIRDRDQAEELAQGTFVKALEALGAWERRNGSRFGPWLFKIANNELGMHLRNADRVRLTAARELSAMREDCQLAGREAEPAEAVSALDWLSDPELVILFRVLGHDQRAALTLRFCLDYTNEQIAVVLDKSPGATKKLVQRALGALERRLTVPRPSAELRRRRNSMETRVKPLPVLARRRFALG